MNASIFKSGPTRIYIIVICVVLVGIAGFFAWQSLNKKPSQSVGGTAAVRSREDCEKTNDKDVCHFIANWEAKPKYRVTSVETSGQKLELVVDGNNAHTTITGPQSYEMIAIDKSVYVKAGDIWYKQTLKAPMQTPGRSGSMAFGNPTSGNPMDRASYKSLGKEACGSLTCFKYEVTNPQKKDVKETIWFDDKEYKVRRAVSQSAAGSSDSTFSYDNISVTAPTPVKELAANQYIMPGQTEPQTVPSGANMGQQ